MLNITRVIDNYKNIQVELVGLEPTSMFIN